MSVPAIVPSRRPPAGRVAGFAALLVGVSWALAVFSAWPWHAFPPGAAVLRISFNHVSAFAAAGTAALSPEDIAKLPAHMRPADASRPSTGRRRPVRLTVSVDGAPALVREYLPGGWRHDGPLYGYEELRVTPGRHTVSMRLADVGGDRDLSLTQDIDIVPGAAPLFELRSGRWRGGDHAPIQ